MTSKRGLPPSFYFSFAVPLVLVLLFLAPSWLRKTQFEFSGGDSDASHVIFPMSGTLPIVVGNGLKQAAISLQQLAQNQTLLINFWATWCPPCIEELPSLETLNRQLNLNQSRKVPRLVLISVDENPKEVHTLFKTLEFVPSFLVLHDKDGNLAQAMGSIKFPETYWVDHSGRILHKWIGPQDWLSGDVIRRLALAH